MSKLAPATKNRISLISIGDFNFFPSPRFFLKCFSGSPTIKEPLGHIYVFFRPKGVKNLEKNKFGRDVDFDMLITNWWATMRILAMPEVDFLRLKYAYTLFFTKINKIWCGLRSRRADHELMSKYVYLTSLWTLRDL